jgi:hypothetical protein
MRGGGRERRKIIIYGAAVGWCVAEGGRGGGVRGGITDYDRSCESLG